MAPLRYGAPSTWTSLATKRGHTWTQPRRPATGATAARYPRICRRPGRVRRRPPRRGGGPTNRRSPWRGRCGTAAAAAPRPPPPPPGATREARRRGSRGRAAPSPRRPRGWPCPSCRGPSAPGPLLQRRPGRAAHPSSARASAVAPKPRPGGRAGAPRPARSSASGPWARPSGGCSCNRALCNSTRACTSDADFSVAAAPAACRAPPQPRRRRRRPWASPSASQGSSETALPVVRGSAPEACPRP
mmetsp:Transcript_42865/g.121160  ORF Transcript_42865/g.121160 Transcript_42865/m.121160 type:complete len:245 (-) Transcript_42865:257-991(-)